MQTLEKSLRAKLENTIKSAREIAEKAARAALEQLGVEQSSPYPYLTESHRDLRRRLRAHGRQLGDVRNVTGEQEITRLTEEVAYEHWHRMLFARFLAENDLLMFFDGDSTDDGVPITQTECDELASELGYDNGWELAARMATRMLPQIFRPDSPVFSLALPPELQHDLEGLIAGISAEVFTAADSLGWVYQFWQAKKKEEVNQSEVKIGARELPAVTQLFTEPYMVSFLLDNSLGAWWAARRLTSQDLASASSEEELRQKASLPGVPLEYLRFVKAEDGVWTPAAGNYKEWPENLAELKVLDPCCGSGHFLVSAFLLLVPLRMELECLTANQACDAVLQDNLHGLELDQRCVELAAFAVALTAWRYPAAGGYRKLPSLQVACSGLTMNAKKEEWLALADGNDYLRPALEIIYGQFQHAPVLGSLLNPEAGLDKESLFAIEWDEVAPLLAKAFGGEADVEKTEMGVAAYGMATAASLLVNKYHWVITNVPYLARGKQSEILRQFCEKQYAAAKNDLATVFLDRCLEFCECGAGVVSVVLPQNWLFLGTYKKFREKLLKHDRWRMIGRLGAGAFETISGEVVQAVLLTISQGKAAAASHQLAGIDAAAPRDPVAKATLLRQGEVKQIEQARQLGNPDARITLIENEQGSLLSQFAYSYHGLTTGDMPRMKVFYWEVEDKASLWFPFQGTVSDTVQFGGNECLLRWENGKGTINELLGARKDGLDAWGKEGIVVSQMRELPVTTYSKNAFDNNTACIVPHNCAHLTAIWCFCSSPNYSESVRRIDQKLSVTSATLVKVPFDLAYWQQVAAEKYPNGLPKPYSDDPTQWIFHGHPAGSDHPLQVAVARLLGYRWPAELDETMELSAEAKSLVEKSAELLPFADEDGIVCIPAVRGEAPASDRLLNLLAKAYEGQAVNEQVATLLTQADSAGRSLESWLRDKFFSQHCKLFHHRPFIWHVWDGLPDGFSSLVNYHKLDRKNLETLIYTYLGDWINRQKDGVTARVDGAGDRLAAAETLKRSLELILQGEKPLDVFVRWKPITEQPIGWDPDLNDGVRLNIRPFLTVPAVGKKGAGILRDKPNIDWKKDRGKDVASAPWYQLGSHYGGSPGDRINDHHLTLDEKRKARDDAGKEAT